jgi:hypothetical protein
MLNLVLDIVNVMGYLGNIDALVNSFMVSILSSFSLFLELCKIADHFNVHLCRLLSILVKL